MTVKLDLVSSWHAHADGICVIAWSPDATRLATGGNDGLVHVWLIGHGAPARLGTCTGHTGSVRDVDFSPDGALLASGAEDGSVILWDAQTFEAVGTLSVNRRWVNSVRWSPDGTVLASAGGDRRVELTDRWGCLVTQPLSSPYGVFLSVAWSPDGRELAATCRASIIPVWDTRTWERLEDRAGGPGPIWTVCWWQGGFATGNGIGSVTVDTVGGPRTVATHDGVVARVEAVPGGRYLVSLSHDRTLAVVDVVAAQVVHRSDGAYPGWVGCLDVAQVSVADSGPNIASTDNTGTQVRLWTLTDSDSATGPVAGPLDLSQMSERSAAVHGSWWIDTNDLVGHSSHSPSAVRAAVHRADAAGHIVALADAAIAVLRPDETADASDPRTPSTDDVVRTIAVVQQGSAVVVGGDGAGAGSQRIERIADGVAPELESAVRYPSTVIAVIALGNDIESLITDIVCSTLFTRWAMWAGGVIAVDDDETQVAVLIDIGSTSTITVVSADERLRSICAGVLERRVSRHRSGARVMQKCESCHAMVSPGEVAGWVESRRLAWALRTDALPADVTDAVAIVDETIDDERARQLRVLLLHSGIRDDHPPDAIMWHSEEATPLARSLAAGLLDAGLRTLLADPAVATRGETAQRRWVESTMAATVSVVIVTDNDEHWGHHPLAPLFDTVMNAAARTNRRVRWIPLMQSSAVSSDVPAHLRSFDWYQFDPNVPSAVVPALVGAVLVDRSRS